MQKQIVLVEPCRTIRADAGTFQIVNGRLSYWHGQVGSHTDTFIRKYHCPMSVTAGALGVIETQPAEDVYVQGTYDIDWCYHIHANVLRRHPVQELGCELQFMVPLAAWTRLPLTEVQRAVFDRRRAEEIFLEVPAGSLQTKKHRRG